MYFRGSSGRRGVVDEIVEALSDEIRMGILRPGDRLPSERMLCDRFGVGRSSVREALRVLSSMGLIEIQMGRGSFVADPDAREDPPGIWDRSADVPLSAVMEVRLAFEPQMAALAARRAGDEHLERLEASLRNLESHIERDSLRGRVFADMAFHEALARASGNPLYLSICRGIEPLLFEARRAGLRSLERSKWELESHAEIYGAVKRRSSGSASRAMWHHVAERASELGFDPSGEGLAPPEG
jgi:GntR family transcriptional repressor for pyruvate dehydrogenase complex